MKRLLFAALMLLGACAGSASCSASERVDLASVPPPPEAPPSFTDPNDVDASRPDGGDYLLACIATEWPSPWATCSSIANPSFKCATDIMRDNDNCGGCGIKCGDYDPINMTSRCVDGACVLQCYKHFSGLTNVFEDWTDCNGLVEDGCEINLTNDPKHCGACGNACPEGVPCFDGKCGCAAPYILCDGKCVHPDYDDFNCGGCGIKCEFPDDACSPLQDNTTYGCVEGVCGRKRCTADQDVQYYDCNKDVFENTCGGDGCETAGLRSREHCGKCGNKCVGDEECVNEGNGYECAVPCKRSGKVKCGGTCVDLLTDRDNCGACGHECRLPGKSDSELKETSSCREGMCVYECDPGFGDCNGDPKDGCETNLWQDPQHCGACGVTCDLVAGQPCIEGKCLMKECDAGVTN